jgi:hypothetical protein
MPKTATEDKRWHLTRCPKCGAERTDGDFTCRGKRGAQHEPTESERIHWYGRAVRAKKA